jgi:hypothetical protein
MSNGRAWLLTPLTPLLAVLLAVGIVGMHGVSAADATPATILGQHGSPAPHSQHAGECDQDGPSHVHPGPVCKSAAVPTAPTVGLAAATAVLTPAPKPARVSPATVAEQAARGNGRGPPSLDELSISRT